jgi:hypothetical protein
MAAFRSSRRHGGRWWFLGTTLTIMAFAVLFVASSSANLTGSPFESTDGNKAVNGTTCSGLPCEDWDHVNGPKTVRSQTDLTNSKSDDAFGQGTSEDDSDVSVVLGSIPPQKSDLSKFYEYDEKIGSTQYLYLAWERTNNLGSANMDFELNQASTDFKVVNGAATAGKYTINRTAGDLLINYDFGGSGLPTTALNRWIVDATHPSNVPGYENGNVCFKSNSFPCWGDRIELTNQGLADGSVSADTLFGETAINLSAALPDVFGPNPTSCESIGSAFLKSRSSASFTAELKDFVAPTTISVSNCGHVLVHKTAQGSTAGQSGATFTIAPGQTTGGTTATSSTIPEVTGQAGYYCIDNLLLGASYTVTETAAPAGYDIDPNSPWTGISAVAGGCAGVSYTTPPTAQVNAVDPPQVGAIKITKTGKDKACTATGAPDATCSAASTRLLNGAVFQLKTGTTVNYTSSPTAGTGSGAGVVCIGNVAPGSYTLHESTAPSGYQAAADSTVTVVAGTTCAGTGSSAPLAVSVVDQPLTTITVSTTPQVAGTTQSTVQCTPATATGDTSAVATPHTTNAVVPGTYVCTVVIDP